MTQILSIVLAIGSIPIAFLLWWDYRSSQTIRWETKDHLMAIGSRRQYKQALKRGEALPILHYPFSKVYFDDWYDDLQEEVEMAKEWQDFWESGK